MTKEIASLIIRKIKLFYIVYRITKKKNALNSTLYFSFFRWLLHVSAKQCHPQEATTFLSESLQRQYDRRQVIGRMTGPTYQLAI
jgi:hypothetical protein